MTEPDKNSDEKYDQEQVSAYWKRVHNLAVEGFSDRNDELLPVVADPGAPDWEKRYVARFQNRAFLRTIRRFPGVSGLRGLEFGCGTGRWVKSLVHQGANMVGIDISEDVIKRNRNRYPGS